MHNEMISHRKTLQQTKRSSSKIWESGKSCLSLIFSELPWYFAERRSLSRLYIEKCVWERESKKKVESAPKITEGFSDAAENVFSPHLLFTQNANGVFHAIKVHRNVIINKIFYFKSKTFSISVCWTFFSFLLLMTSGNVFFP